MISICNLVAFTNGIQQHLIFSLPFFFGVSLTNLMYILPFAWNCRGCIGRNLSSHVPLKEVRNIFALSWILQKGHLAWVQISYGEKTLLIYLTHGTRFYFSAFCLDNLMYTENNHVWGHRKDAVRFLSQLLL